MTLPAATVAALVKNVMQFMPLAILAAAGVAAVNSGMPYAPWIPPDPMHRNITHCALALGSIATILIQYGSRRTIRARTVGVAAALVAILAQGWLSREASAAAFCVLSPPTQPVSVRFSPVRQVTPELLRDYPPFHDASVMIAIPIELAGAPAGIPARFNQLAFEIEGSEGDRYEMRLPAMIGPPEKPLLAVWLHRYDQTSWQIIRMDRAIYNRLQKAKVRIRGNIVANFYRVGSHRVALHARRIVPEVGTCSSLQVSGWSPGEELIRVDCESPAEIPSPTVVRLIDPNTRREWPGQLGDSITAAPYPRLSWLSPINRRSTFFHVTTQDVSREGSRWLVPKKAVSIAEFEITPQPMTACTLATYEFSDVLLSRFQIAPTSAAKKR